MEAEKKRSENIDIPKKENRQKDVSVSPTWSWIGWGKKGSLPENAKDLVTDPNVLHHINNAPKKTNKELMEEIDNIAKKVKNGYWYDGEGEQIKAETKAETEAETEDETEDEYSVDSDEMLLEPGKNNFVYYLGKNYSDEVKSVCLEFKRSLMFDWNNIPNDVKIFGGAAISMCYNVFPHVAVLFLGWQVLEGIVENRVRERIEDYEEWKKELQFGVYPESNDDFESSEEEEKEEEKEEEEEEKEEEEKECV